MLHLNPMASEQKMDAGSGLPRILGVRNLWQSAQLIFEDAVAALDTWA